MSCSDLNDAVKAQLYYALKSILGYGNDMFLDGISRDKFLESVEKRDPELVAQTLAKVRLGLQTH
tara:strand:+ start:162 stop:356 length:195 start_codon:yes stop_codon:yes gene_type:complete